MKKTENNKKTAIIVPAYNCQEDLEKLVEKLKKTGYFLIIVDDHSKEPLKVKKVENLRLIRHQRNFGYGGAIRTGIKYALKNGFEYMVLIDGDGQHFPEDLEKMLAPLYDNSSDFVTGTRYGNIKSIGFEPHRDFGVRIITALANLSTENNLSDFQCCFRSFNRPVAQKLSLNEDGMEASIEMVNDVSKNGFRILEVPVKVTYEVKNAHSNNIITHGLKLVKYCVKVKLLENE